MDALATPGLALSTMHFNEFFDALVLLHQGRTAAAMRLLIAAPEHFRLGQRDVAAVVRGAVGRGRRRHRAPGRRGRIRRARLATWDNPVAAAIVDRAEALAGDRAGQTTALAPAAAALSAAGCRYQWARTLVAIGGAERARGEAELAAMGATVMAWPPG